MKARGGRAGGREEKFRGEIEWRSVCGGGRGWLGRVIFVEEDQSFISTQMMSLFVWNFKSGSICDHYYGASAQYRCCKSAR